MAIHRIRINYTVYPPDFLPDKSPCWDFRTFTKAKSKARGLGIGALVYRNFNQADKDQPVANWWGDRYFWFWSGLSFEKRREIGGQVASK